MGEGFQTVQRLSNALTTIRCVELLLYNLGLDIEY